MLTSPFFSLDMMTPAIFSPVTAFISPAQRDASEIKKRGWEAIRVKARCEFQAWLRVFLLLPAWCPAGCSHQEQPVLMELSPSDQPLLVSRECSHSHFPGAAGASLTQCSVPGMFFFPLSFLWLWVMPLCCLFLLFFSLFVFLSLPKRPKTLCPVCAGRCCS